MRVPMVFTQALDWMDAIRNSAMPGLEDGDLVFMRGRRNFR